MAKLRETKKVLYFKIIHNLDIRLTIYPKICPAGLQTAAIIYPLLENKIENVLATSFKDNFEQNYF